ncbi:MAG: hypothetical protein J5911_01525 [Clostridia bacterium]|nr:hypothetical protein [Clostridia bacterium]
MQKPFAKRLVKPRPCLELAALILLFIAAFMLATSRRYQNAVISGIELWAAAVLPALFPYLVITALVSSLKITGEITTALSPLTKRLFNVGGAVGYALFISLTSGYPVGAKTVSDLKLKGATGDAESVRAAALCSSSSPTFLIGSVGNLTFNSPFFGLLLFITHILSVFVVGVAFAFYKRKDRPQNRKVSFAGGSDNILYDGVFNAVISVLVVGGIITVFYLLTEMLTGIGVLDRISGIFNVVFHDENLSNGVATGIFECTKGLKIIAKSGVGRLTLPLAGAICGFGGVSVIMQSVAYLKKAKIKTAPFFLSKVLAAVVNFCIGFIISAVFLR